jgi:hypothetical protein
MTCTWLEHDLNMTWTWLAHDLHMTCTWLAHDLHKTCIWLAHDLHMTCTWLAHDLHMTCTWLPNLKPFLQDWSIEKVDIGDNKTRQDKTRQQTQEPEKITHRLKIANILYSP